MSSSVYHVKSRKAHSMHDLGNFKYQSTHISEVMPDHQIRALTQLTSGGRMSGTRKFQFFTFGMKY